MIQYDRILFKETETTINETIQFEVHRSCWLKPLSESTVSAITVTDGDRVSAITDWKRYWYCFDLASLATVHMLDQLVDFSIFY